jgi:hypothetical protein
VINETDMKLEIEETIMNTGKLITRYLSVFALLFASLNTYAEEMPFRVHETDSLKIKLAENGTGIVQGIKCEGCDFNFVRITANSKATIDGVEVSILEAKKMAGKFVMVSFNPETQEVQYIRW